MLAAVLVVCAAAGLEATTVTTKAEDVWRGRIVKRSDEGIAVQLADDLIVFVPAGEVAKVALDLDASALEKLDPKQPQTYYDLGLKLLESNDPGVVEVGARLLHICAKLDPKKFYRKAYLALYKKNEGAEKFRYGSALLAFDPNDAQTRSELERLAESRQAALKQQYVALLRGLRAWSDGRTVEGMFWIAKVGDREVLDFASRETGMDFRLVRGCALFTRACPDCKGTLRVIEKSTDGTGQIVCPECKGTGQVRKDGEKEECEKCKGFGTIDGPESKGTGALPCQRCESLRKFLLLAPPDAQAVQRVSQRILSMLVKGDPDLKSPTMLAKVPQAGRPVFMPDDYERIVFRDGAWRAE